MKIGPDLFRRVSWAHVNSIWIVTQLSPFWFDDSFEELRVSGEYVLVDLQRDGVFSLAGYYFDGFAAQAGDIVSRLG